MTAARLLFLAAALATCGCSETPGTARPTEPPPQDKSKEKEKGDPKRPRPQAKPPEPVTPTAKIFDDVWAEAVEESKRLDAEEPAQTEAAEKLLTAFERGALKSLRPSWILQESQRELIRLGQRPWLNRQSRAAAASDATFKEVARLAWERLKGKPNLIVGMMNEWGLISPFWRTGAVNAIKAKTPAAELPEETRDAIVQLIGPEWFTAK